MKNQFFCGHSQGMKLQHAVTHVFGGFLTSHSSSVCRSDRVAMSEREGKNRIQCRDPVLHVSEAILGLQDVSTSMESCFVWELYMYAFSRKDSLLLACNWRRSHGDESIWHLCVVPEDFCESVWSLSLVFLNLTHSQQRQFFTWWDLKKLWGLCFSCNLGAEDPDRGNVDRLVQVLFLVYSWRHFLRTGTYPREKTPLTEKQLEVSVENGLAQRKHFRWHPLQHLTPHAIQNQVPLSFPWESKTTHVWPRERANTGLKQNTQKAQSHIWKEFIKVVTITWVFEWKPLACISSEMRVTSFK